MVLAHPPQYITMSISALFILDQRGRVILSRNYRGDISMDVIEIFSHFYTNQLNDANSIQTSADTQLSSAPCITLNNITYIYIQHNNILLVTITQYNINIVSQYEYLYSILNLFQQYFTSDNINEEIIRDNFVVIYELLDEICDYGYTQYTDSEILKSFIVSKSLSTSLTHAKRHNKKNEIPVALTNSVNWRADNIKHKKMKYFWMSSKN